jgi:hypothetical protein
MEVSAMGHIEKRPGRIEGYLERWRIPTRELGAQHITSPTQQAHWLSVEMTLPDRAIETVAPPLPSRRGPSRSLRR